MDARVNPRIKSGDAHDEERWGETPYVPELKARGAGLTVCGPLGVTRTTLKPRSFVPSGRKRNTPSMPEKPDDVVSVCSEKRCGPCVFTSAAVKETGS